jgi:hypothetical protein
VKGAKAIPERARSIGCQQTEGKGESKSKERCDESELQSAREPGLKQGKNGPLAVEGESEIPSQDKIAQVLVKRREKGPIQSELPTEFIYRNARACLRDESLEWVTRKRSNQSAARREANQEQSEERA